MARRARVDALQRFVMFWATCVVTPCLYQRYPVIRGVDVVAVDAGAAILRRTMCQIAQHHWCSLSNRSRLAKNVEVSRNCAGGLEGWLTSECRGANCRLTGA